MRLSSEQRQIIIEVAHQVFGETAQVKLFGSRIDDAKRGGDIDLLVQLPDIEPQRQRKALTCVALLQQRLGDQPVDVLVIDPASVIDSFRGEALHTGIPL